MNYPCAFEESVMGKLVPWVLDNTLVLAEESEEFSSIRTRTAAALVLIGGHIGHLKWMSRARPGYCAREDSTEMECFADSAEARAAMQFIGSDDFVTALDAWELSHAKPAGQDGEGESR